MTAASTAAPGAVVMNMFYTGLGIARSLGEREVEVIGLTSQRRVYGNFTRYADVRHAPDSRREPEALLRYLIALGEKESRRWVLFPTRDDDLVFIDRFRSELAPYFSPVAPRRDALQASLDKAATYEAAGRAKVAAPRAWAVESFDDLERAGRETTYPCVMKPLAAHHWRQGSNWELVGGRKAFAVGSPEELRGEYRSVAKADSRVLIQEMIAGPDDRLLIVACYIDRDSRWVAGFNTRKRLQVPEGFGTGCIVESGGKPELFEQTSRLLQEIGFSGIAEVEYKWDENGGEYKLIEINPRPWDQHRLGNAIGVDLMYVAYCDHAGLPIPQVENRGAACKWVAEEAFATAVIHSFGSGSPDVRTLFARARGQRIYAIWWWRDPIPAIAFWVLAFCPEIFRAVRRRFAGWLKTRFSQAFKSSKKEIVYVEKSETLH